MGEYGKGEKVRKERGRTIRRNTGDLHPSYFTFQCCAKWERDNDLNQGERIEKDK